MRSPISFFLLGLAMAAFHAKAATFQINAPSADRWMYPFASNGGGQAAIQVFGAVGEPDFDDRDGQMYVRFDTTGVIAAGLGASNYQVSALTLTLTLSSVGTIYDPTYDPYASYLDGGTDSDAGRPVEVYGVGFRNDATAATWQEDSSFGGAGMGKSQRSAYAAGFDSAGNLIDVSNNVSQGFDAAPWAVGQVAGVAPGSALSADMDMTFTFNLSDPSILAYLQAGFNLGYLDLMVTSLYGAEQPGTGPQTNFPVFYSKESPFEDASSGNPEDLVAGRLGGSVTAVPEPEIYALLGLACGIGLAVRFSRSRHA